MGYLLKFSNSFDCVHDRQTGRSVNTELERKPKEGVIADLVLTSHSPGLLSVKLTEHWSEICIQNT
jgi:hypothetical protein